MELLQAEIIKTFFINHTPAGINPNSLAQATRCLRCAGLGISTREDQAQRAYLYTQILEIVLHKAFKIKWRGT